MQVKRTNSSDLTVTQMPDGSSVILDRQNETVIALNAAAGAAWNACSEPTTIARVTEEMQRTFDSRATEDVAEDAILQLQEKNLVATSGIDAKTTRRKVIGALSAAALPMVVSLTMGEQKLHALKANSVARNRHGED